jgi:hypothetical protein
MLVERKRGREGERRKKLRVEGLPGGRERERERDRSDQNQMPLLVSSL